MLLIFEILCDWNFILINYFILNLSNYLDNVKDKVLYFDIVEFKIF